MMLIGLVLRREIWAGKKDAVDDIHVEEHTQVEQAEWEKKKI